MVSLETNVASVSLPSVEIFSSAQYMTAAATHRGCVRAHNEDAYLVLPERPLWAVADGMGGHEAGDIASQLLISMLADSLPSPSFAASADHLEDIVAMAHDKIRDYAARECQGRPAGTTLVLFMVNEADVGLVLWAGDSRLYRLRDGHLDVLTRDHSKFNEMVDRGVLTEQAVAQHKDRHVITRAVGANASIFLDCALVDVCPADTFLLCSDGLYDSLDEVKLASLLNEGSSVKSRVDRLMDCALKAGARDNITAVVLSV